MPNTTTVLARIHAALLDGTLTGTTAGTLEAFTARFAKPVVHPTLVYVQRSLYTLGAINIHHDHYVIGWRLHIWLCTVNPVIVIGDVEGRYNQFEMTVNDDKDVVNDYMERRDAIVMNDQFHLTKRAWLGSVLRTHRSTSHVCITLDPWLFAVLPKVKLEAAVGSDPTDPRRLKRISAASLTAHDLKLPKKHPGLAEFTFDQLFETTCTLDTITQGIGYAFMATSPSSRAEYVAGEDGMRWLLAEYGLTMGPDATQDEEDDYAFEPEADTEDAMRAVQPA